MRHKNEQLELNQLVIPLQIFMEAYNQSLPVGFPRVSVRGLREFRASYPMLFKHGDAWSIDKHRKRLMDWLVSHRDIV